jgi:hypothetical protein
MWAAGCVASLFLVATNPQPPSNPLTLPDHVYVSAPWSDRDGE